ncbi:HNH endonuclease signature motif containing protein [Salinactinospora qingdaonensis]|uniref:HNH nuclease domain-containing protein n=1 Tax=Salinactinospora qingdaonensis TaxID=702744 RepID=A0ABP7G030_9ACTN
MIEQPGPQQAPSPNGLERAAALLAEAAQELSRIAEQDLPPGVAGEQAQALADLWPHLDHATAAWARAAHQAHRSAGRGATGQPNLEKWMQTSAGIPASNATKLAATARAAATLPDAQAAFEANEISLGHYGELAHGVEKATRERCTEQWPEATEFQAAAEQRLLEVARLPQATCGHIGRAVRTLRLALNPDRADQEFRHRHEQRSLNLTATPGGGFYLEAWGDALHGEILRACLDTAPTSGDERTSGQRRFDALVHTLTWAAEHRDDAPTTSPRKPLLNVIVPLGRLTADQNHQAAGAAEKALPHAEPARTDTGTLLPDAAVRALATDCWLRRILTDPASGTVLDVGRTHRLITPGQRRALQVHHTTCAWHEGCDVPVRYCQGDHVTPWSRGGSTNLANLQPLCRTHNLHKHYQATRHHPPIHDPPGG